MSNVCSMLVKSTVLNKSNFVAHINKTIFVYSASNAAKPFLLSHDVPKISDTLHT